MTVVGIVQARLGSTRLPGKVLREIAGRTMLERVVRRARAARTLERVVVATTDRPEDAAILTACAALGVACHRGDADDVLGRFLLAAEREGAAAVARITADCPLLDPAVVDTVGGVFLAEGPDYASNTLERTWPIGLDVEFVSREALERAGREARAPHEREHVTPYLYEHPALFRLRAVTGPAAAGAERWTVDTAEDLDFARAVCARLGPGDDFGWREVAALLEREPGLRAINSHVRQRRLHGG